MLNAACCMLPTCVDLPQPVSPLITTTAVRATAARTWKQMEINVKQMEINVKYMEINVNKRY
jgi:hypothetical protein